MIPESTPASMDRATNASLSSLRFGRPKLTFDRPPVRRTSGPCSAAEAPGRLQEKVARLGVNADGQDQEIDVAVGGRSPRSRAAAKIAFALSSRALHGGR